MYMLSQNYRLRIPLWIDAASAMTMAGGKGIATVTYLATGNKADDATLDRYWIYHQSRYRQGSRPLFAGCADRGKELGITEDAELGRQ